MRKAQRVFFQLILSGSPKILTNLAVMPRRAPDAKTHRRRPAVGWSLMALFVYGQVLNAQHRSRLTAGVVRMMLAIRKKRLSILGQVIMALSLCQAPFSSLWSSERRRFTSWSPSGRIHKLNRMGRL
jgi:hypothetical protein